MLRKKLMTIIGIIMISIMIINGTSVFEQLLRPIEVNAQRIGLETSNGSITANVGLIDNIPENASVEKLKYISVTVNPSNNSNIFCIDSISNEVQFNIQNMYLTNTIYNYSYYDTKLNQQVDEFIKILGVDNSSKVGYINKQFSRVKFINGVGSFERNINICIEDEKAYNYMLTENDEEVPTIEEEVPTTAEEVPIPPVEVPMPPVEIPTPPVEVPTPPTEVVKNYSQKRLGGLDRYDTSIAIAKEFSNSQVDNIVVASATDFPDALSGSVLAAKYNAPILLVGKNKDNNKKIINQIKTTLKENGKVYILGGVGAVNSEVEIVLRSNGITNIERLGGIDRYETSVNILNEMEVKNGTPIVIANSLVYADSLSISSIAGKEGMPILLSNKSLDSKVREAISRIQPSQIYVVGGEGAVTSGVVNELKKYAPVTRIGGIDRYETSLNIAKYFNLDTKNATIAYGLDFPDALGGSALATKTNSPILLVGKNEVTRQKEYLDSTKIENLYILGGTGVISERMANDLIK